MLLTEEQARTLRQSTTPVEILDPTTQRAYMLLAREQYERVRDMLNTPTLHPTDEVETAVDLIPEGILRSQQAFWRNLPALLAQENRRGQWVCYQGEECIGIAADDADLICTCLRRGLPDDSYYLGRIEPHNRPPWEIEEVAPVEHKYAAEQSHPSGDSPARMP